MEKAVRRDFEHPAAVAFHPRRAMNDAAVVIVDRRRVSDGERSERMLSHETPGLAVQRRLVEGVSYRPLVPSPER